MLLASTTSQLNAQAQKQLDALADRFFDEYYFPNNPTTATSDGIHKYDGQLEDYSKAGVVKRASALHDWEGQFAKLPQSDDRDLVLSYIRASLLELETIREWTKNPDNYSSGITSSAFTIMARKFAPPEQLPELTDALLARGYSEADVRAILGENMLRVARAAWRP